MFPFIPLALSGLSALGGLFGGKKATTTTTPTLDPAYGGLQSQLLAMIQKRLTSPSSLPAGYEAGQIGNINRTYDLLKQSQGNSLTARGLGTSPVAGAVDAKRDLARGGEIVRMQQGLPLLERQMQNEDLGLAQQLLSFGRGTQSTAQQPGGMAGGAIGNLAEMLAYLWGKGAFGASGTGTPGTGLGPNPMNPYPGFYPPGTTGVRV